MNILKSTLIACITIMYVALSGCDKAEYSGTDNSSGKGGSLARFTVVGDYMYVVDKGNLYSFDISTPDNPRQMAVSNVGFNVETIYPFKDKLFIGSQEAMYIYSLSDPAKPSRLGEASHLRACDPVVANDSMAYVTVRTGTNCGGSINALYSYNVRNPLAPVLMNTRNLGNPKGLALNGSVLYVCDDVYGLAVMSLDVPTAPFEVKRVLGGQFHDAIVLDDVLICMIEGGMLIYDLENPFSPQLLSRVTN